MVVGSNPTARSNQVIVMDRKTEKVLLAGGYDPHLPDTHDVKVYDDGPGYLCLEDGEFVYLSKDREDGRPVDESKIYRYVPPSSGNYASMSQGRVENNKATRRFYGS